MELRSHLTEFLLSQGVGAFSEELTFIVVDRLLRFDLPYVQEAVESDVILALSFGNREDLAGNILPGPVNEALAAVVCRYYKERPRKVYAQWEIAEQLKSEIDSEHLISLNPRIDPESGESLHLSTQGVVNHLSVELERGKKVFVVAHRDHLVRATWVAEDAGFLAYGDTVMMPIDYDEESALPWTRSRMSFLKHDFQARLRLL